MLNSIIGLIFFLVYAYQIYYIPISIFRRVKPFPEADPRRYAILICARNESGVIGQLIDSIHEQDYPQHLVDIHIIADNCTDNTADVARRKGAFVVERRDSTKIGKGFALNYLLDKVTEGGTVWDYEGFFVLDADNLLERGFLQEMNKAVCAGNRIVTCYRNSKNYGDNWLAASYALWFLRESKYLNNSRQIIGGNAQCSGTGFVVHSDIFREYGVWNYFTLTEDVEFTMAMTAQGERIAYCPTAIIYDEQPVSFKVSWKQRTRWVKGYFQSYRLYFLPLVKGIFLRRSFACFDMLASTFMGAILSVGLLAFYLAAIAWHIILGIPLPEVLTFLAQFLLSGYAGCFIIGIITTKTEWGQIYCSNAKKVLFCFTFPLFLITLMPITICAPFSRQRWPHIAHTRSLRVEEIKQVTK
jgi:cellulose synthase/poly-beta-1,6-N-acetylglucosamine synthase-like glycosyltransferase